MKASDPTIRRALKGVKRTGTHWYWRVYERFLEQPPVPASPASLLFVCKGNICRSPFAEAMARRHFPQGLSMECRSGGIEVEMPEACPPETVAAAARFGVDLSGHRSRRIDAGLVAGADMVLAMEAWQAGRLRKVYPEHRGKIFLLSFFEENPPDRSGAGSALNIRDPYGKPLGDFIECFERIDACLKGIFSEIRDGVIRSSDEGAASR